MDVQAWRDDLAYLIDRIQLYDKLPAKPALLELLSEFNSDLDLWGMQKGRLTPRQKSAILKFYKNL